MTAVGVSSLPAAMTRSGSAATTASTSTWAIDHDLVDVGDLGRVVVEVGHADDEVARVEGAHDLGVRRRQRRRCARARPRASPRVRRHRSGSPDRRGDRSGRPMARGSRQPSIRECSTGAGAHAASRTMRRTGDAEDAGNHGDAFPFTRGRGTSRSGWRPGSRAPPGVERGYSSGTAPASHRLLHSPVVLAATAPVDVSSVDAEDRSRTAQRTTDTTNPPATWRRRVTAVRLDLRRDGLLDVPVEGRLAGGVGQHRVEHLLDGQRVRAAAGGFEQVAVALPRIGVEGDGVGAVVAGEAGAERPTASRGQARAHSASPSRPCRSCSNARARYLHGAGPGALLPGARRVGSGGPGEPLLEHREQCNRRRVGLVEDCEIDAHQVAVRDAA